MRDPRGTLEKVEEAIAYCERENVDEVEVTLSYAELRGMRRDYLVDQYTTDLAGENLRAGLALSKSMRETRKSK
jgi:hypothetical protein